MQPLTAKAGGHPDTYHKAGLAEASLGTHSFTS